MNKIPQIDSIEALAHFWDTHNIVDFEDELEEVKEKLFDRNTAEPIIHIQLLPDQADLLKRIAKSKGMDQEDIVKEWVLEKLKAS